jgi:hypothetical protein
MAQLLGRLSWLPWARYSHWDAARNGKVDGVKGIPTFDQQLQTAYIMQLKQVAEENIARLAQNWRRQDQKLLADFCKAKRETEVISAWLNKAEEEAANAANDERSAQEEYIKHFHLTPFWYRALLIGIGIVELPMNTVVFQLFGEAQLFNVITSLGLGLVLPTCAHFTGGFLKQGFFKGGSFSTHTTLIIALIGVALGSLAGIAYVREKFFESSDVQQVLGIQLDYTAVTLIFFLINLLIFVVATVAAYVTHDPDASRHWHDRQTARKLLKNARKRVRLLEERQQEAQAWLYDVAARRNNAFEHTKDEAKEMRDITQKLISVYQTHNVRRRSSPQMPVSFTKYPPIDVPVDIDPGTAKLQWECERGGQPTPVPSPDAPGPDATGPPSEDAL